MAAPDYRALAAQAHIQADAATLANVRARFLRAEAAWLTMAHRQDLTELARAQRTTEPSLPITDNALD